MNAPGMGDTKEMIPRIKRTKAAIFVMIIFMVDR